LKNKGTKGGLGGKNGKALESEGFQWERRVNRGEVTSLGKGCGRGGGCRNSNSRQLAQAWEKIVLSKDKQGKEMISHWGGKKGVTGNGGGLFF